MFTSSIRNRVMLSSLALILILLVTLGSYMLWFFHKYNIERLSANLQTDSEITEQLIRPYINGTLQKSALDLILKKLAAKVDRRFTIIDPTGSVLADSWEDPALMDNHSGRPEVITALAGETGKVTRYSSTLGKDSLYIAVPIKQGQEITGVLRISTTLAYIEYGYKEIRNVLLLSFLIISFIAVVLSIRLSRRYTAPIEAITGVALQMAAGHLDRRVDIRTGDELEVLGHTLNNLASSLDAKVNEIMTEKRKLELVFENMDNPVILFDRRGRVMDANKQALHLFKIKPAMYGQHYVQVMGISLLDKVLKETIQRGERHWIDLQFPIQGVKRAFQIFLAPITTPGSEGLHILTVFHDITALREVEERQADFVANASHELGTPLTAIKGFAETLLDGALEDAILSKKFVTIIHEEAERMHRLVNDLLLLARINSSEYRQHIKHDPISIHHVAITVIRHLSPRLEAKSIEAELNVTSEELSIRANSDWLNQILINLIENSIKFTPDKGKIFVRCWQEQDKAIISVQDTGIGIPTQDIPFIFDRFYRVDRARAKKIGGTGLGLAIVKFMVETLGGTIEVQSKVDVGSTFIIKLPIVLEDPAYAEPRATS